MTLNRRLALVGAGDSDYMKELESLCQKKGRVLDGWTFSINDDMLRVLVAHLKENRSFYLYYHSSKKRKEGGFIEYRGNVRKIWTGKKPRLSPVRSLTPEGWLSNEKKNGAIYRTWLMIDEIVRLDRPIDFSRLGDFRDNITKKPSALRNSFGYVVDPATKNMERSRQVWWYHTNPNRKGTSVWERKYWRKGKVTSETPSENALSRKYMTEMKKNDVLIRYSSGNVRQVSGIGKVVREAYKPSDSTHGYPTVDIRCIFPLRNGIPLSKIKEDRVLSKSEPIRIPRFGTFFRLTQNEYQRIQRLIIQENPESTGLFDQVNTLEEIPKYRNTSRVDTSKDAETREADEGEQYTAEARFRIRNWKLIEAKKKNSDYSCEVCKMSFEDYYGSIGSNYIIAHHKVPIGGRDRSSKTTLDDINLVCANCHSMLHQRDPPLDIDELRSLLKAHAR